jgi:adenine phosphoribosyltransferase
MYMQIESLQQELSRVMKTYSDFPKPGIQFRDISPVLANPKLFDRTAKEIAKHVAVSGATYVAALESRGFLFGISVAQMLGLPFVPIRKPSKLPGPVHDVAYELEYGEGHLQVQQGVIPKGAKVAIVDDLLATGGTALGAAHLVEISGANVSAIICVVELLALGGRRKLQGQHVVSLVTE